VAMQEIKLTPAHFHGAVSLDWQKDGSVQPWRIDLSKKEMYQNTPASSIHRLASMPSGVRVSIRSDCSVLRLTVYPMVSVGDYDFDLVVDGKLFKSIHKPPVVSLGFENTELLATNELRAAAMAGKHSPGAKEHSKALTKGSKTRTTEDHVIECDGLPPGIHTLELWLSSTGPQRVRKLEVDSSATVVQPLDDTRPRWITYGSSVTHGMAADAQQFPGIPYHTLSAHSPSRTWPATAALKANLNLTSLGFGGQAVLDQMIARQIRDTPADCISLKLGINVHNTGSHNSRAFGQAALGFILTVRDGHPTTPLLIVSPLYGAWREDMPQSKASYVPDDPKFKPDARFDSLKDMRKELKRIVEMLQKRGDKYIQYLDGLDLFGQADCEAGLMPDNLHPSGDGYELIGNRFANLAFGPEGKLLPSGVRSKL